MYSSMYFVYNILNNFPNSHQKVGIICKLRSGKFITFPGDTADWKLMRHLASGLMGKGPLQLCLSTPPATQIPAVRLVCVTSGMVAFHVHVHIAQHTGSWGRCLLNEERPTENTVWIDYLLLSLFATEVLRALPSCRCVFVSILYRHCVNLKGKSSPISFSLVPHAQSPAPVSSLSM